MGDGGEIEIVVLNWEKYNARNDIKIHSWLRINNSMWNSQTMFPLSIEERWTWICILSIASQRHSESFQLNLDWFCHNSNIPIKSVLSALDKLTRNGCVTYALHTRVTTGQDSTGQNIVNTPSVAIEPNSTIAPTQKAEPVKPNTGNPSGQQAFGLAETKEAVLSSPKQGSKVSLPTASPPALNGVARSGKGTEVGKKVQGVIAAYVTAWQSKYGTKKRPDLSPRYRNQIASMVEHRPFGECVMLVQVYCQMPDKWFEIKYHDLDTFFRNVNKVAMALDTGRKDPKQKSWEEIYDENHKQGVSDNGERPLQSANEATILTIR